MQLVLNLIPIQRLVLNSCFRIKGASKYAAGCRQNVFLLLIVMENLNQQSFKDIITDTFIVASQSAMLALTNAQIGILRKNRC